MTMKAVIFDLDNTLYSYDRAHAAAWSRVRGRGAALLGVSPEEFDLCHSRALRLLDRRCGGGPAIHNRLIRFQLMLESAGLPLGPAAELAELYWRSLLAAMEPEPGAAHTLQTLHGMGLRVGIGTNMNADMQLLKLDGLGLLPWVEFMVSSEECAAEKPDPRFFALCAEKAGCPPADCLFVGDSLEKDALAAAACGMAGAWYHPGPGPEAVPSPVHLLPALDALPALLQAIDNRQLPCYN